MIKIDKPKIIRFLIYFNFLFPSFDSIFSNVDFGLGYAIINFIITMVCLSCIFVGGIQKSSIIAMSFIYFAAFFILISASMLLSPNKYIYRDLFEFHRPFYYGSMFILPLTINWNKDAMRKYIIIPIIICFLIQIAIGLCTVLPFDIIKDFRGLYTKAANVNTTRATGTFGNPYDYGFVMVFIISLFIYLTIFSKGLFIRIVSIGLFMLAIISVMMSQSRTAAIVMMISIVYSMVLYFIMNRNIWKALRILGWILIFVSAIYIFRDIIFSYIEDNYRYLYSGLKDLLTKGVDGNASSRTRFEQLGFALSQIAKRPLIGYGPSKGVKEFLEMQYSLYLYRYGIFGIAFVIFYLIYSFVISFKALLYAKKRYKDKSSTAFFFGYHVWCAMLPVASFGNAFIDITRISMFFFLLNGLCTSLMMSKAYDSDV